MKRISVLIIFLYGTLLCLGQVPYKFSFQAVVRNGNNQLVTSQTVGVRVSILEGSATGDAMYTETFVGQTEWSTLAADRRRKPPSGQHVRRALGHSQQLSPH